MFKRFHTPPIWQWWNTSFYDAPELIRYCHKTVKAHNDNVLLTIGSSYSSPNLRPDHESDIVRAELLYRYSGIWLDVDYLCWGNIHPHVDPRSFNVWRRDDGILDNDFLAAPQHPWGKHNYVSANFFESAKSRLSQCNWSSDNFPTRGYIGADLLNDMHAIGHPMHEVPTNILCPYRRMVLNLGSYTEDPFVAEHGTTGMMLLNSLLEPEIRNASIKELAASSTVLGAILRFTDSKLPLSMQGFDL